ncbi:MAG: hypothetical protein KKB20_21200 [Proteobacteria bacterium]|nr:hypothetical protein [Pseudomonadota bacterium]
MARTRGQLYVHRPPLYTPEPIMAASLSIRRDMVRLLRDHEPERVKERILDLRSYFTGLVELYNHRPCR